MADQAKYLKIFRAEADEHLQGLAQDLLVLAAVLVRTVVPVDASDKIA